jgi:uncharacterized protein (DUF2147 family)
VKNIFLSLLLISICSFKNIASTNSEKIIGKWLASEDKNLVVEVYKSGNEFRAKIIWFDDSDDKSKPMAERCDTKNPDKKLRTRKIIGLQVMQGLVYNAGDDEWKGGQIYDASSGKQWNAKAWLTTDGCLKVRGYWHFEFMGQNICFKKVQ